MTCSAMEISQLLSSAPELFLKPTTALHTEWVTATKRYLDPLASDITKTQRRRLLDKRKRKNADGPRPFHAKALRLQEIHVNGFTTRQVWEQANRVLEAAAQNTAQELSHLRESEEESLLFKYSSHKRAQGIHRDDNQLRITSPDGGVSDDFTGDGLDNLKNGESSDSNEEGGELMTDDDDAADRDDSMSIDAETPDPQSKKPTNSTGADRVSFIPDPNKLNDGFFSIDKFNAQTALFERKDVKGIQDDDEDDDEEAIDWGADPLSLGAMGRDDDDDEEVVVVEEEEEEEEEEEDDDDDRENASEGGDADAGAMDADGDFESELGLVGGNANDIKYADFFDPPRLKASKGQQQNDTQSKPKSPTPQEDIEASIKRVISDVQRDLFDDDVSDDEDLAGSSTAQKGAAQSTHEKRRAKLTDEIRRLEAANVSKKEWMLSGEAKAPDRPINSLIEEDLEFERVGKPVPVISNEVSDNIEALIKRRILAREFDEVPRRQPYLIPGSEAKLRREQFTLDETKPQQSLGELYEEDHLRKTDSAFVDRKSAKVEADHDEITRLWNNISSQLDALSSWNYRPKRPQVSVNVVADVATIAMEDVRPTGGAGVDEAGILAPQEVYAPVDGGKVRGETTLRSGVAVSKEEMTREAKRRRRRREKQKLKKSSSQQRPAGDGKQAEKQRVVDDLMRGGVKVIGKQGDLKDVYGGKVPSSEGKGQTVLKL
ncbi:hypothetical protein GX48_05702 [Paracoccidioides brasiliensis]|nr:hypothetical protein GX48_05702 [Paracoccidioides brasiliensis]